MNRKLWIPLLSLGIVALVATGFILVRPSTIANASGSSAADLAAPDSPALTAGYYWSYAAKFVCGYQSPTLASGAIAGEPVVKPGNYATEINIQNYNFKTLALAKKIIVLVDGVVVHSEPDSAGPSGSEAINLQGDFATLDDCNNLWLTTHPQTPGLPTPMPLFIGYLVIFSPLDLNVNAVYTANAPGVAGTQPTSASIDVLTVTGKRVFVPTGAIP